MLKIFVSGRSAANLAGEGFGGSGNRRRGPGLSSIERESNPLEGQRSHRGVVACTAVALLFIVSPWSFDTLEREVKMNLAYRDFTHIGLGKVPDAKTLARIAQVLGGEVIARLHERLVKMAQERGVVRGRQMRVDTTVVETNIHYPADSSLPGDGARVLTRGMKKIEQKAGKLKRKVRDRTRSVNRRTIAIATARRHIRTGRGARTEEGVSRFAAAVAADSQRHEARAGRGGADARTAEERTTASAGWFLAVMLARIRQVVKQAKARVFDGITQMPGKIVSLFEPHSEIIRKGKTNKPTEFGKLVQVQETENQIITHYDVFDQRPSDRELLLGAVETPLVQESAALADGL